MRKSLFTILVGISFITAFPFLVQGEEPEDEEPKIHLSTVESIDRILTNSGNQAVESIVKGTATSGLQTVEDSTEFVKKTVDATSNPVKKKAVSTTAENVGDLTDKAVSNTLPAAKTVVKETTKIADQVVSDVDTAIGSQVGELEKVPVVSPIVKEVGKTVTDVTKKAKETVEQTGETINKSVETVAGTTEEAVDAVTDTAEEISKSPSVDEKPVEEPRDTPYIKPVEERNETPHVKPELPANDAVVKTPSSDGERADGEPALLPNETKNGKAAVKDETTDPSMGIVQEKTQETVPVPIAEPAPVYVEREKGRNQPNKEYFLQNVKKPYVGMIVVNNESQDDHPLLSISIDEKESLFPNVIQAAIPVSPSSPSNGAAAASPLFVSDGSLSGVLSLLKVIQPSTDKLWYHNNSYAIIQWFHTPLGKPPKFTPFSDMM